MDDGGAPFPQIGTDLYDNVSGDEEPLDSGPVIPKILQGEDAEAETAARQDEDDDASDHGNGAAEEEGSDEEEDEEDNEDIPAQEVAPSATPAKKRGRPSLAASGKSTPKTPKGSKAATGRKRKADASVDEPAAKRPGRGRATAAAASEAIKQSQEKRPKAANGTKAVSPQMPCFLTFALRFTMCGVLIHPTRDRPPRPLAREEDASLAPRPRRRKSTRLRKSWSTPAVASPPSTSLSGRATRKMTAPGSPSQIWRTPQTY